MNRKEKILKYVNKNGRGIEIGPSHNPITPKKDGYNVHIIDHLNREGLVNKYKNHNVNINNIEEVDFIWKGQPFSELTGKDKYYDWIIVSHVIEHTPDLVGFINDCDSVLKDDGAISLVVPDKRYCFDRFRPISGISKVIDSHFYKQKTHTPGTVVEFNLDIVTKAGEITWKKNSAGNYNFLSSPEKAFNGMKLALNESKYMDVHAWCFVPHSFRLMIHDLYSLGLIPFQETIFYPTVGCEFYVTISKKGKGIDVPRLEMLKIIDFEVKETAGTANVVKSKRKNILKRLANRFAG